MNIISPVDSLRKFNQRVLMQGAITTKGVYELSDIKQKLFFNSIFISNMNEIFQKYTEYDIFEIINLYINDLKLYNNNIKSILSYMRNHLFIDIDNSKIENINDIQFKFIKDLNELNDKELYYLIGTEDQILIAKIDDQYLSEYRYKFLRSDEAIIKYLNKKFNGYSVLFNIIRADEDNKIIKIETNKSIEPIKHIISTVFNADIYFILNPAMNLKEITTIIKSIYHDENHLIPIESLTINDIFDHDILLRYPDSSFDSFLNLLNECIENNSTKLIFITIYRIGSSEAIFNLLKKAVSKNIKVIANIELNAYGEKINKMWEDRMIKANIQVVNFGKDDFKIHSKLTLILFKSNKMIAQIGTGNYHTETTKQYTDMSFYTSDKRICNAALSLVNNFIKKDCEIEVNKYFLLTKYNFKNKIIKMIKKQIKLGDRGYIGIKCNSLDDEELIGYLEKARRAGCKIDLIVRGICTWIPDNILRNVTIKSIIWDKLEHSRLFWFGKIKPVIYIGSLDPVTRKINNRIELMVRIMNPEIKFSIMKEFNAYLNDYEHSWLMDKDGKYIKMNECGESYGY